MENDEGRIFLYMIFVLQFDSESFSRKYFISLKTNTTEAGMVLLQWYCCNGSTREAEQEDDQDSDSSLSDIKY